MPSMWESGAPQEALLEEEEGVRSRSCREQPRYLNRDQGQSNVALAAGSRSSSADVEGDVAFATMLSGTCSSDQAWILDSGASRHITGDFTQFATLKSLKQEMHIDFGNKTGAKVKVL